MTKPIVTGAQAGDGIKRIPAADFLVESGLLFEINRTILHPLGLAVEVLVEADGTTRLGDLWDYREDPEGILFYPGTFVFGAEKLRKFKADFGAAKIAERRKRLGFVIQERPDQ